MTDWCNGYRETINSVNQTMTTYQQGKFEQVNIFYPFSEGVIPSIFKGTFILDKDM